MAQRRGAVGDERAFSEASGAFPAAKKWAGAPECPGGLESGAGKPKGAACFPSAAPCELRRGLEPELCHRRSTEERPQPNQGYESLRQKVKRALGANASQPVLRNRRFPPAPASDAVRASLERGAQPVAPWRFLGAFVASRSPGKRAAAPGCPRGFEGGSGKPEGDGFASGWGRNFSAPLAAKSMRTLTRDRLGI